MTAKDKSFNASLKTEFDPNVGSVNIISQDIGRVLLNLINKLEELAAKLKQVLVKLLISNLIGIYLKLMV